MHRPRGGGEGRVERGGGLCQRRRVMIPQAEPCALGGEPLGDPPTDARRAAGDDSRASREPSRHATPECRPDPIKSRRAACGKGRLPGAGLARAAKAG